MSDLFQYFRIEARELVDELSVALSGLARGGPATEQAGIALRHAHTLKGAARVVARTAMADRVHELEEMLGPFRSSADPVPPELLERMQTLVDALSDELETASATGDSTVDDVVAGAGPAAPEPLAEETPVPLPRSSGDGGGTIGMSRSEEPVTPASPAATARASLAEIDSLIDGVSQTRTQLGAVRDGARRARRLRATAEAEGRFTEEQSDELLALARRLETGADRIERELREVYTTAERLRLIPVDTIVPDLERGVRDVTAAQGKHARLEVRGAEIALDATVLAGAQTALRQIVRNAVAHGVEMPEQRLAAGKERVGRVRIEVTHSAAGVRFRCVDDGSGIDLAGVRRKLVQTGRIPAEDVSDAETLRLLLGGGISTAATVSEISGHGIGLDVVQDVVRRIGGRIEISTTPGRGTTIDLIAPASMTAQEVVLVRAGGSSAGSLDGGGRTTDAGSVVALPLRAVRRARRIATADFPGPSAVLYDGRRIPYAPLPDLLGLAGGDLSPIDDQSSRDAHGTTVLLLDGTKGTVAVGVSRLIGTADVAVRALPALAPVPPLVAGLWIDLDGCPRPVLDPAHLAATVTTASTGGREPRATTTSTITRPGTERPGGQGVAVLIVDDSLTTRMVERSILESAGYLVDEAGSAEEGLSMAARKRYALAVVDVEMPGMDGFGFIEQTRTRPELRHLPCVLLTTKASPEDRERGRAAGARGHIDKGEFHQSTLLDTVAGLIAEGARP
ncbi:hybrid sensor histidine kinase/response regulator [Kineosporia succinea]|uniref:histidine kinase n=1 Tax=Kineosporia succinea TaxID=84632 RepID=A0ABT9P5H2_9ACTN|nr:response regulator [Kineosporia succinea]MDP9827791.1 two-component system chemotaxis sensor kinase CheA [Kineosporia succinea]